MKGHTYDFPIKKRSEVFKVSRSGYYKWIKDHPLRLVNRTDLDTKIKQTFEASRSTYGSPRVHEALEKQIR